MYRLQKYFNGVKRMRKIPDILIVIDQKREIAAIKEARALNICIISILDTNCNPDLIDMPIPGNDDSSRSIKYIIEKLAASILLGKKPPKTTTEVSGVPEGSEVPEVSEVPKVPEVSEVSEVPGKLKDIVSIEEKKKY
jgi:small subunit ribosomal protein S2